MELQQLTTFPFILTSLIFFIFLLKILKSSLIQNQSSLLPPGPNKLPLIGNLHHLRGLPHHFLRDLANKYGPVMHLQLGELSTLIVSSPDVVKQLMKTHDLAFSDRPNSLASKIVTYGDTMGPYGELWRQLRKVFVVELLSAKRVQSFWTVREEEVMNLVQRISLLAAGSPINLSQMFVILSNDITTRASFGKTCQDKEAFLSITEDIVSTTSGFAMADLFPSIKFLGTVTGLKAKLERIHQKLEQILDNIIKDHVAKKETGVEEDLVDVLLRLQEDGGNGFSITTENVKAVISSMFLAGTDTSSTLMEWTFSELLRNPRVMHKAQTEVRRIFNGKEKIQQEDVNQLSYLRLIIKETLRMHPPAPLLVPRECRERCEIEGYVIPKGTILIINSWAMGRDPENWTDPDKFEPERFQDMSIDYKGNHFAYIPFGAGRRICPGISFGTATVELTLAMLLYHFDWQIANQVKPEELDMTEVFGSTVQRKK